MATGDTTDQDALLEKLLAGASSTPFTLPKKQEEESQESSPAPAQKQAVRPRDTTTYGDVSDRDDALLRGLLDNSGEERRLGQVTAAQNMRLQLHGDGVGDLQDYFGIRLEDTGVDWPDYVREAFQDETLPVTRQLETGAAPWADTPETTTYGVDFNKMVKKLVEKRMPVLLAAENQKMGGGRELTVDERIELAKRLRDVTQRDLREAIAKAQGQQTFFIDDDPNGTTQEIADRWERYEQALGGKPGQDAGWVRAVGSFFEAWLSPYSQDVYDPNGARRITQHGGWDWVWWLGNGAPNALVATGEKYGYGTPEQIKAVREGESLADPERLHTLGDHNPLYTAARDAGFIEDTDGNQMLAGLAVGLPIMLVEPDAVTVTLNIVGKGLKAARLVKRAKDAKNYLNTAKQVGAAAEGLEAALSNAKGTREVVEALNAASTSLGKIDPRISEFVDVFARAELQDTGVSSGVALRAGERAESLLRKALASAADIGVDLTDIKGPLPSAPMFLSAKRGTIIETAKAEYKAAQSAVLARVARLEELKEAQRVLKAMDSTDTGRAVSKSIKDSDHTRALVKSTQLAFEQLVSAKSALAATRGADDGTALAQYNKAQGAFAVAMDRVRRHSARSLRHALQQDIVRTTSAIADARKYHDAVDAAIRAKRLPIRRNVAAFNAVLKKVPDAVHGAGQAQAVALRVARAIRKVSKSYTQLARIQTEAAQAVPSVASVFKAVARARTPADEAAAVVAAYGNHAHEFSQLANTPGGLAVRELLQGGGVKDAAKLRDGLERLRQFSKTAAHRSSGTAIAEQLEHSKRFQTIRQLNPLKLFMQDQLHHFMRPGTSTVGPAKAHVQQIGKGMLDAQRLLKAELAAVASRGASIDEQVVDVVKYVDGVDTQRGVLGSSTVINTANETSLWADGMQYLRGLARIDRLDGNDVLLDGLARVWIKTGRDAVVDLPLLHNYAVNIVRYGSMVKPKSPEAIEAAELAAESLTFEQFMDKMLKATAHASKDAPGHIASTETLRAHVYAGMLLGNMALIERGKRSMRVLLAGIEPKTIEAMEDAASGYFHRTSPEQLDKALDALSALGIPRALRTQASGIGRELRNGVTRLDDQSLLPSRWLSEMTQRLDAVIKRTDAFHTKAENADAKLAARILSGWIQTWKMGLTTGVIFPKPRYYFNMLVGNFAQIWAETGFVTAMQNTSQTLTYWGSMGLSHMPVVGKQVDAYMKGATRRWVAGEQPSPDFREYASARMRALKDKAVGAAPNPDHVLPPPSVGMFNPYVAAIYDANLAPAAKKVKASNGVVYTMGEIRRALTEEGVLTSFANTAVQDVVMRRVKESKTLKARAAELYDTVSAPGGVRTLASEKAAGAKKAAGQLVMGETTAAWGSRWANMADIAEQRQRVALFTDLVFNKGYSPKAAGRVVRNSLYDWGHALGSRDLTAIGKMMLFGRFWRLALRQGARVLFDPIKRTSTTDAGVVSSAFGLDGKVKRVRQQALAVRSAQLSAEAEIMDDPELDSPYKYILPWWSDKSSRPFGPSRVLTPEQQAEILASDGYIATHSAKSYAAFTPVDTVAMLLTVAGLLVAPVIGRGSAADSARGGVDLFGSLMSEPMQAAFKGFARTLVPGMPEPREGAHQRLVKSPTASYILPLLGVAERRAKPDNERAKVKGDPPATRAPAWAQALWRIAPVLGTDVTYWYDPAHRAYHKVTVGDTPREDEIGPALVWLIQQYLGAGSETPHWPENDLRKSQYSINEQAGELSKQATRDKLAIDALDATPPND